MAIAMCGDTFTELGEQRALFDVLRYTDVEHAWPTTAIQETLKEAWGWYSGDVDDDIQSAVTC
jgi:hypothetical protein